MPVVETPPLAVKEIEHCWIALSDGCRLAARIWMPEDAEQKPVPAILEYLPYRKRDGTIERDELNHPYVAGHGYACVRVDIRGNGESEGLMEDEYLKLEQDDALQVIAWIAGQAWCTGKVGMIGISWGGFNGLQVAARCPPALKAVITICSTDDRYADDIHYMGGCLLNDNLSWASTMMAYSTRPPDPLLVGEAWRAMWMERLENMPLLVANWLSHQRRDAFWKHGSICEDFGAIEAAVFAVGGWADGYSNVVSHLLSGLKCPVKGLVGPWAHKYPHFASPGPAIGFLQECLRWWDYWLKGIDTGVMGEPRYRVYLQDSVPPASYYESMPGRWITEQRWPSPDIAPQTFFFNRGALAKTPGEEEALTVNSAQTTGAASGRFFAMGSGAELPIDQAEDDANSLVFETRTLTETLTIFGSPNVCLAFSSSQARALIAVRLCDVRSDGSVTRLSYGLLNLTHRNSHENPEPLRPGEHCHATIRLNDCAWDIPAGHRLRLSISTAYWPLVWPSPRPVTLTIFTGRSSLDLPVRSADGQRPPEFGMAVSSSPLEARWLREPRTGWSVTKEFSKQVPDGGKVVTRYLQDYGEKIITAYELRTSLIGRETYRIEPDDPLSAHAEMRWSMEMGRAGWNIRSESKTTMWSDEADFHIRAELDAYEGENRVFSRVWNRTISRDFV